MRFHSVPKRIWVMPNAPRQQTYSSPRLQRAFKTATCVFPDSQNAFKPIPSAPRQQTCNPRLHGPQTATCGFTASQNAFGPCPVRHDSRPSVAKVPTQDSHMRFPDSQNAFKPIPSAPRQQTCNPRPTGPKRPHTFSQPPKTHLSHAQCTTTADLQQSRLQGPQPATCFFTASQNAFKPCLPSPGHKRPQQPHAFSQTPKTHLSHAQRATTADLQ